MKKELRNHRIQIAISSNEKEIINYAMKELDDNISRWARVLIFKEIKKLTKSKPLLNDISKLTR